MSRQPHYGISLLDVVVAIALAAILSTLIFQALQQTRRTVKKIQATVDINSMLIHFKARIFKDVQGTFIPQAQSKKQIQQQPQTTPPQQESAPKEDSSSKESLHYFVLERININEKTQADHGKLNFITTSSLIIHDAVTPRAVRVEYELKKNPEKKSWQLLRSESAELDYKKFMDAIKNKTGITILTNIESLEILAYGPKQQEKSQTPKVPTDQAKTQEQQPKKELTTFDTWNSDERKKDKKPVLPEFIQIKGSIRDENLNIPVTFSCMIPIEAINGDSQSSIMDQLSELFPGLQLPGTQKGQTGSAKPQASTPAQLPNQTTAPRSL